MRTCLKAITADVHTYTRTRTNTHTHTCALDDSARYNIVRRASRSYWPRQTRSEARAKDDV